MKKITLALCACAFALTGLLASCSSGSKDFIDLTEKEYNYKYAVNGTVVTTNSNSYVDGSDKVVASSSTSTSKIEGGFVTVSWKEDETRESNYDTYSISGTAKSSTTTTYSSTYDDKAQSGTTSATSVGTTDIGLTIQDVDGDKYLLWKTREIVSWSRDDNNFPGYTITAGWYDVDDLNDAAAFASNYVSYSDPDFEKIAGVYLYINSIAPVSTDAADDPTQLADNTTAYVEAMNVTAFTITNWIPNYSDTVTKTFKMDDIAASEDDDAFDGDFGKEFSINIKIDSKDEGLSYTKENANKVTNAGSVEYKLTFVPVEDYDPADFADED